MHASSPFHRRLLLGAAVGLLAEPVRRSFAQSKSVKAIAFDGFVIIDPRPVAMRAEELFPAQGARLMDVWRSRQFEYTWLRTLGPRGDRLRRIGIVGCGRRKAFGYPTFWVNRAYLPAEELGVASDATGAGIADLVKFVGT